MLFSIDGSYHSLKKSSREYIEEQFMSMGIAASNFKHWRYINIPVSVGLSYSIPINTAKLVFVRAGLFANFLKATNFEMMANNIDIVTEFDQSNNFGFRIGGGVMLNRKTSITLDYFVSGEHEVSGTIDWFKWRYRDFRLNSKGSMLSLTVGFKLSN